MAMQYSSSVTVDNLYSTRNVPEVRGIMAVAAGQELKRGALLDESGVLCAAGSEVYAVLLDDVTTTDAAVDAAVSFWGEFNEKALSVAEGATVEELKKSARKVGIFIKPTM